MRTKEELLVELHAKRVLLQQNKSYLENPLSPEKEKVYFLETIEELTAEITAVERLLAQHS
jgi:hypothetical protein